MWVSWDMNEANQGAQTTRWEGRRAQAEGVAQLSSAMQCKEQSLLHSGGGAGQTNAAASQAWVALIRGGPTESGAAGTGAQLVSITRQAACPAHNRPPAAP